MIFFDRTSVGLFLRPITHSRQNRPLNQSSKIGIGFFGFAFLPSSTSFF